MDVAGLLSCELLKHGGFLSGDEILDQFRFLSERFRILKVYNL